MSKTMQLLTLSGLYILDNGLVRRKEADIGSSAFGEYYWRTVSKTTVLSIIQRKKQVALYQRKGRFWVFLCNKLSLGVASLVA